MSFTRLLRPRRIVVLALAGALVALAAGPSPGASLPDSHTQPLADGCQRSDAMQLALATPEWTYAKLPMLRDASFASGAFMRYATVLHRPWPTPTCRPKSGGSSLDIKPLRQHQMQMVLGPSHGHIQQSPLFLDFLACPCAHV